METAKSIGSPPSTPTLTSLCGITLLVGLVPQAITEASITATMPEMAKDFGDGGELAAQMMLGLGAIGLMLGALLSGRVVEWLGTRWTLMVSLVVFGFLGAFALLVQSLPLLGASRVAVGFAASCIATASMWGVSARFSGQARARVFAIAGALSGAAAVGSVIAGGFLTQHFGWRMAYAQFPFVALLMLAFVWGGVQQEKPQVTQAAVEGQFKRLLPLYGQMLAAFTVIGMSNIQMAFVLEAAGVTDAGTRGLMQGIPGLGLAVGAAACGAVHKRWGGSWPLVVGMTSLAISLALFVSSTATPVLGMAAFFTGLCMGMLMPYFYNAVSERTPVASVQRYLGYLAAFTFFGAFASVPVFLPVKAALGMQGMYWVAAGVALALACGAALTNLRGAVAPGRV